jgi:hypothetical protein
MSRGPEADTAGLSALSTAAGLLSITVSKVQADASESSAQVLDRTINTMTPVKPEAAQREGWPETSERG